MQKLLRMTGTSALVLSFGLMLGLGFAAKAPAATIEWSGTFTILVGTAAQIDGTGPPGCELKTPPKCDPFRTGTGVSTVTGTGIGDIVSFAHLDSIRMDGGITFTGTAPLTDPENATLVTLMVDKTVGTRVGIPIGRGTFAPISGGGALTDNQLVLTGLQPVRFKQCLIVPGCSVYLPIPVSRNGTEGAGIGGIITVNTFSKGNGLKISVVGTPWTIGAAVITGIPNRITTTANGGITNSFFKQVPAPQGPCGQNNAGNCTRQTITTTRTQFGFAHGPASATSSTALLSGVIQFVTPSEVSTSLDPPNNFLPVFSTITLHFVPEPGLVLLLGSGVAGLALLGRHRLRK